MVIRRSRRIQAPVERIWTVAADPYHLPRWWPRTQRVEGVGRDGWTSVLGSDRGRSVRADYRLLASEPPALRRWALEIAGTPFERIYAESETELRLEADDGGTAVTLSQRERPRGWARFGGPLLRRAGRRRLDEALEGLAALVEEGPGAAGAARSDAPPAGGRRGGR